MHRKWRGRAAFEALLKRAGYTPDKKGLARLSAALGEHMEKPPTAGSLRVACLARSAAGFKKAPVNEALCRVLSCRESDLYDGTPPQPLSTWDRIRAGVDVEDRLSWPL